MQPPPATPVTHVTSAASSSSLTPAARTLPAMVADVGAAFGGNLEKGGSFVWAVSAKSHQSMAAPQPRRNPEPSNLPQI